jgi:MYXO-CTERM domain-containing protein
MAPAQVATVKVVAGTRAETTLTATDPALEADPLTWSLVEGGGSIDAAGSYAWDTTEADVGTHVITARVSDDDQGAADAVFTVEVEAPQMATGCGCATGSELGALGLLAAALFRRRRSTGDDRAL